MAARRKPYKYEKWEEEDENTDEDAERLPLVSIAYVHNLLRTSVHSIASSLSAVSDMVLQKGRQVHRLEGIDDLLQSDILKPATHFYTTDSFYCKSPHTSIGQHHFMITSIELSPEDKEWRIKYLHYREFSTHIREECGISKKEADRKKRLVWEDELRIKNIGREYEELVPDKDKTGRWTVAGSRDEASPLLKALRAGKWRQVTDDKYPKTEAERSASVIAGMRRLREMKFDFVTNNCEIFVTSAMLKGEGYAEQLKDWKVRACAHVAQGCGC